MIELIDVRKDFPSAVEGETVGVLKGITRKIESGRSLVIVGPSGSGKSTLLNILGALDRPSSGQVLLDGQDLAGLDERQLAQIRNRKIGFVFQLHHLLPQCTVLENVLAPTLASTSRSSKPAQDRAIGLLERVGLADRKDYRPGQLSGGQRQRVVVARALVNGPALLLADEPTGSLDEQTAGSIAELLVELNRSESVTLVAVTHSLKLAERIGHVVELRDGLLVDGSR